MKTIKMTSIPTCSFCKKPAVYDAPTWSGPWAYLCEDHAKTHSNPDSLQIGSRLELKPEPATPQDNKPLLGKERTSLSGLMRDEDRIVSCPDCNEERTVEMDASYVFNCEGCGKKVRCLALI